METSLKYRKERERHSTYRVHHYKGSEYNHPHVRFVVPWQMYDLAEEKDKAK